MSSFDKYNTKEINEKDKNHHLHPWQIFDLFAKDGALPIVKGEGAYVYDSDGNRYLDAVGGLWCTNIGQGREDMVEAITQQVRELAYSNIFVDGTNPRAAELCVKLAELSPGNLNHVFLSCGGSTAVDSAYRLIQYYQNSRGKTEKKHFISRINSYHGSTYLAMSLGGKPLDHSPLFEYVTDNIHHLSCPNYYRAPTAGSETEFVDSLVKEFEDKIAELGGADKVAAYFAEPIMGAGGVIVPPEGYNRRMWEVCQRNDILYVSDEVVTGFGRLGEWFASESIFNIQPDIIVCAKGLTSGYLPLGATIFSDEIFSVIAEKDQGRCFTNGYTYSGHPVSCTAALKNIEIIENEKILEHVKEVGPYFQKQLKTLLDLPVVGDVRGNNMMACVEMVSNKETKALFPVELNIGKWIANEADKRGLFVRPIVNLNVMSPPLIITKEQVDFIVITLRDSIESVMAELQTQGLWNT